MDILVDAELLYFTHQHMLCCLCRFLVENTVLDKYVRYILTIYPVIIVALTGNITKNYDPAAPSRNAVFIGKRNTKNI